MSSSPIVGKFSIVECPGTLGQAGATVEVRPITPGFDMHATVEHVEHAEDTIAVSFSVTVTPHAKSGGGGLASLPVGRRRAIASQGGQAAHQQGAAHVFTSEEARAAGLKGGRTVSADRSHMAEIGAKGGKARSERLPKPGT